VRHSRKQTGEAVTISKEEMELLRANDTVDDMPTWAKGVYALDEVTAKDLPAEKSPRPGKRQDKKRKNSVAVLPFLSYAKLT
jgi:hypothetical protein